MLPLFVYKIEEIREKETTFKTLWWQSSDSKGNTHSDFYLNFFI